MGCRPTRWRRGGFLGGLAVLVSRQVTVSSPFRRLSGLGSRQWWMLGYHPIGTYGLLSTRNAKLPNMYRGSSGGSSGGSSRVPSFAPPNSCISSYWLVRVIRSVGGKQRHICALTRAALFTCALIL